jgi:Arc/MetJ-type ribon-helix-helix transcriptional regulator
MSKEAEIINIRLPEEIVKWLDTLVEKKLYRNRSEAIREFARDYILKNREDES